MKILEPNSLIAGVKRVIDMPDTVRRFYKYWKALREHYEDSSEMEAFYIGYMIGSNTMLKQKFLNNTYLERNMEADDIFKGDLANDIFKHPRC